MPSNYLKKKTTKGIFSFTMAFGGGVRQCNCTATIGKRGRCVNSGEKYYVYGGATRDSISSHLTILKFGGKAN